MNSSAEHRFQIRRFPSLNALRTFETAARLRSFKHAAGELAVTESAVSRQIKILEEDVGQLLFVRTHRTVALTDAGERLSNELQDCFGRIQEVLLELGRDIMTLRIKTLPTIGVRWLLPRINQFEAAHPNIRVRLAIESSPVNFRSEDYDAGIVYGYGPPLNNEYDYLLTELVAPFCSPEQYKRIGAASDFRNLRLLCNTTDGREWRQWFGAKGMEMPNDAVTSIFDTDEMAIQAALANYGVGLFDPRLVESERQEGRLVRIGDTSPVSLGHYYFIFPRSRLQSRTFSTFRKWIAQTASTGESQQKHNWPLGRKTDNTMSMTVS